MAAPDSRLGSFMLEVLLLQKRQKSLASFEPKMHYSVVKKSVSCNFPCVASVVDTNDLIIIY